VFDHIRIPALTEAEDAALRELLDQWQRKLLRNQMRTMFYEMKNHSARLMSGAVPDVVRRRAFVLNWSATAVDKLNRRCNLDGFYAEDGTDLDALGLDVLIRENRLVSELSQAGTGSLVHGVSFLATVPGDPDKGEPKVLVLPKSATAATGMWDVRRKALRSFLSVDAVGPSGEPTGMTLFLDDLTILLTKDSEGRWSVDRTPHGYGVPVDVLRYRPTMERPYGSSRITRTVLSLHEQALAAMIRADVNGEAYSLPRYVLLGATESSFQNPDGSVKPAWKAAWEAIWSIGDDQDLADDKNSLARADVKQFNGQSPEPQNAHLRMLAQMFSGATGIPIGELGIIGDSNPTSEGAQTVSREDIVMEAETTTDEWTPDQSATVTRALRMLNDDPSIPEVKPIWRNPQHTSRASAADAGLKTVQALPWLAETEVGMEMMGFKRSQIERALAERRRTRATEAIATLRTAAGGIG
jgi:hypothetical protein